MKKLALLAVVGVLVAAANVAEAGLRRGGGCPGGSCSVNMAAAPAKAPALAEKTPAPAPAKETETAATPADAGKSAANVASYRFGQRLLPRRRG